LAHGERSCEIIPGQAKAFHAKAQRTEGAKKTKQLFFASPCGLASLREIVYFFTASKAVGKNATGKSYEPRQGRHPVNVRTRSAMAHTYTNILIHAFFSTKDRPPWLDAAVAAELFLAWVG